MFHVCSSLGDEQAFQPLNGLGRQLASMQIEHVLGAVLVGFQVFGVGKMERRPVQVIHATSALHRTLGRLI
jgi:hypothetical protein